MRSPGIRWWPRSIAVRLWKQIIYPLGEPLRNIVRPRPKNAPNIGDLSPKERVRYNEGMRRNSAAAVVDRLLDPLARSFSPEVARQIVRLRADPMAAARMAKLAEKCNEGTLSAAEKAEYAAAVSVSGFVAILQAKARAFLRKSSAR